MKVILFCSYPYAFSILQPLAEECQRRDWEILWYLPVSHLDAFPYKEENHCCSISELKKFSADIIFVPGNIVPWYLRGLKVQVFHGLAGEKKGHFRIRDYFDLYLTQGPYFTRNFNRLAESHRNFSVIETGWSKLDKLFTVDSDQEQIKKDLLARHQARFLVLYAPTFSPSLCSARQLLEPVKELLANRDILLLVKFHDKMDPELISAYRNLNQQNLVISADKDITPSLQISDLLVSDTSSVIYEFILLGKPVVTLRSTSAHINWPDLQDAADLPGQVVEILEGNDSFREARNSLINEYHPYRDGQSAQRMVNAAQSYLQKHQVPEKRKVSCYRKYKCLKKFGLRPMFGLH
jgi:CDP-ribitol ribitolphosphotransferase / teichoic acid ribitol-phosphate polymerase